MSKSIEMTEHNKSSEVLIDSLNTSKSIIWRDNPIFTTRGSHTEHRNEKLSPILIE